MSTPGEPLPIPEDLLVVVERARARMQADKYTGKLVIEFDVRHGQERRVKVTSVQVGEAVIAAVIAKRD